MGGNLLISQIEIEEKSTNYREHAFAQLSLPSIRYPGYLTTLLQYSIKLLPSGMSMT